MQLILAEDGSVLDLQLGLVGAKTPSNSQQFSYKSCTNALSLHTSLLQGEFERNPGCGWWWSPPAEAGQPAFGSRRIGHWSVTTPGVDFEVQLKHTLVLPDACSICSMVQDRKRHLNWHLKQNSFDSVKVISAKIVWKANCNASQAAFAQHFCTASHGGSATGSSVPWIERKGERGRNINNVYIYIHIHIHLKPHQQALAIRLEAIAFGLEASLGE